VGKARSLRARVSSYFQDPGGLHPRTAQMVAAADRIEWIVTSTEVEALVLEHSLIQSFRPRFNVRLKDDKSYPWLALTMSDEWPRPLVTRGARRRGTRYFGPFGHVRSLRRTVDLLLPTYPLRTCSNAKFDRHVRSGRPCLLYDIERCAGPCVGAVSKERYAEHLEGFASFFGGRVEPVLEDLRLRMAAAAEERNYELAARLRDGIAAVTEAAESQEVVLADRDDLDVVGVVADDLQVTAVALHVRHGRIVGRSASTADLVEDLDPSALCGAVLRDLYGDPATEVPPVVLAPFMAEDEVVGAWLEERRGGPVALRVPMRGAKRRLLDLAVRNAEEEQGRDRLRRAADHNARSKALLEVQEALGLERPPFRIECYDMSHLQGSSYVGSMVVFEDGIPAKSAYRHFSLRTVDGNDDYAAMKEVLDRRLRRWSDDGPKRARGFAAPADLLLIDGGPGQLGVALAAVHEAGLDGQVAVASLAKRFEELFVPGRAEPIRLARGSEGLFLLQRIRDEAHRFAIGFHRTTRGKAMTSSLLDGVPGLGPARRARLLERFGTLQEVRGATLERLRGEEWLPRSVADALYERLHPETGPDATTPSPGQADSSHG
jgi:excinuclease ABC subunit C